MRVSYTLNEKKEALPKLLRTENFNMIILVNKESNNNRYYEGTVLFSKESLYPVGYYSDSWDKTLFTDFNGKVEIIS